MVAFAGGGRAQEATAPLQPINAPFTMPPLQRPDFPNRIVSIVDHGAIAGGETLNLRAVQQAINACHAAGGGMVRVPTGRWLTVPIELKSNVNLYLAAGAELVFTDAKEHYFSTATDARLRAISLSSDDNAGEQLIPCPLISAYNCENIAITGPGKLDGQGLYWWPLHKAWFARIKYPFPEGAVERAWRGLDPKSTPSRPRLLQPFQCRNVLFEGFTAVNSPSWTINPVACENIIIRGLTVRAARPGPQPHAPNTDGINPDSCRNVLIEDCDIDTGDDSIAIKSGVDATGRRRNVPCENTIIRRIHGKRIAIGSEMSAGVRLVFIHDCELAGGMNALFNFKTRRGRGGIVEKVWVQDIVAGPVTTAAILVDMEYRNQINPAPAEPLSERTPRFRDIHFRNIRTTGPSPSATAIVLNGLPECPLEYLSFEGVVIAAQHGLAAKHVRGVTFADTTLTASKAPTIELIDCADFSFRRLTVPSDVRPFLSLKGEATRAISFDAALAKRRDEPVIAAGARASSVTFNSP